MSCPCPRLLEYECCCRDVLNDMAQRVVDRNVISADPSVDLSRQHFANFAEQVSIADRTTLQGMSELGALGTNRRG